MTATRTPAKKPTLSRATSNTSVQIASVPDKSFAVEYIGRRFPGKVSDFQIFTAALNRGQNVLIEGPTGPGKTSAVLAFAAKHKHRFYSIPSSVGIDPSQLFGKFIPDDENGGFIWIDGPVTQVVRDGGVLLLNEINFMPERIASVLFGLLDKRREIALIDHKGEVIRAHRGKDLCWCREKDCDAKRVLVIADMNPDYEGTRPLNKAFRNRFAIQLQWDYDEAIERKLVEVETLVYMAMQLRRQAAQGLFETPISTNMLKEFVDTYEDFGFDFARMNFVNHFAIDERSAVDQVVETHSANIKAELANIYEEVEVEGPDDEEDSSDDWDHDTKWAYESDEN
jgi:nitric oxide reductase NorQ protein